MLKFAYVGVPKFGVTSAGLVDRTKLPVPVFDAVPVPPYDTGKIPEVILAAFNAVTAVLAEPAASNALVF